MPTLRYLGIGRSEREAIFDLYKIAREQGAEGDSTSTIYNVILFHRDQGLSHSGRWSAEYDEAFRTAVESAKAASENIVDYSVMVQARGLFSVSEIESLPTNRL